VSDHLPPYAREAEEWEIIGFCPNCKISMMWFDIIYNNGEENRGRICQTCGFIVNLDPNHCWMGDEVWNRPDKKLEEIRIGNRVEVGGS